MEAQARINQKIKTVLSLERCWPIFLGLLLWGCHSREGTPIPGTPGELPGVTLLMPDTKALFESPSWSPDGTRLAYSQTEYVLPSPNPFSAEIYVLDLESGRSVPLTDNEEADLEPDWSPDGSRIVFVRKINAPGWDNYYLMTMASDGSDEQVLLACNGGCADPAWSPNGQDIAFSAGSREVVWSIWLIRPDGTNLRSVEVPRTEALSPRWSPDNKQLAYVCSDDENWQNQHLCVLDLVTGDERVVAYNIQPFYLSWSPDGAWIMYTAPTSRYSLASVYAIYVVDTSGGNPMRFISQGLNDAIYVVDWASNGVKIVFDYGTFSSRDLYILDLHQYPGARMLTPAP